MNLTNFAVFFEGMSGEQASSQDGGSFASLGLDLGLGLGDEEMQLVEKVIKIFWLVTTISLAVMKISMPNGSVEFGCILIIC